MSIEELMKKYGGAYDSDFEMPDSDDGETEDESEEDETEGWCLLIRFMSNTFLLVMVKDMMIQ